MLKRIAVLVSLLSLLVGNTLAADLIPSDIERFMTTYEQLMPYLDDDEEDEGEMDDEENFLDLAVFKDDILKSLVGKPEALSIIQRNGYASTEAFAGQMALIIRAYIAHTAQINLNEFEDSLQSMSPEEQESLAAMPFAQSLQATRESLAAVPGAHIESILPYLDRLHRMLEPN